MTKITSIFLQIIFVFTILAFQAHGAEPANQFPNRNLWIQSKPQTITNKFYKTDFQIWQRVLPFGKSSFVPIATLTTTNVELSANTGSATKDGDKAQIEAIKQFVGDTYQIKKWRQGTRNKTAIFEGISPISGHYVKLFIKADKKQIRTSLATLEMGFAHRTYLEAEILQRAHIDSNTKFVSQTSPDQVSPGQMFWDAFAPPAYADLPGPQLNNLVKAWGGSGNYRLDVNTNSQIRVDGLQATNEALADASKTLADSFSTVNIARGAFAGTLAGLLAHGLLNGIVSTFKAGIDLVTGSITPELKSKMTEQAQKALSTLKPSFDKILTINRRANALLLAMLQVDSKDPFEIALDGQNTIEDMQKQIESKRAQYKNLRIAEEKSKCANEIKTLESDLAALKDIQVEIERKAKGDKLCDEYKALQHDLVRTLHQLNVSRNVLIDTITLLIEQIDLEAKASQETPISSREKEKRCINKEDWWQEKIQKLENCSCSQPKQGEGVDSANCQTYCAARDASKKYYQNCLESATASVNRDEQAAVTQQIVAMNSEALRELQINLMNGFCRKDGTNSNCQKEDGNFFELTKKVKDRVNAAVQACNPGTKVTNSDKIAGKQIADQVEAEGLLAVDVLDEKTTPNKIAVFFANLYSKITQLFA